MVIETKEISPSELKVSIKANQEEIDRIKNKVLLTLAKDVKIAGFREGKAPANMVEKYVDQNLLGNQFLNEAVSELYEQAIREKVLRVVSQPKITITKFIPFETLEFSAETDYIGEVTIPDYKTIKVTAEEVAVTEKEI